jgi:hypothetical protein
MWLRRASLIPFYTSRSLLDVISTDYSLLCVLLTRVNVMLEFRKGYFPNRLVCVKEAYGDARSELEVGGRKEGLNCCGPIRIS